MRAGYANIDITPPPGQEMTGYGYYLDRRATGTLDRLMGRAVALEEGGSCAVVVQLDLLALSAAFVARVRSRAADLFGLPPEALMLHCTHTHTGPATMSLYGCGMPSEDFVFELEHKLVRLARAALDDLRPVASARKFQTDFPEGFAHNRVGGTDLDTHVRGVAVDVEGGRPILVLSYACHPVTLGRLDQYSADYCGALIREFNAYGIRALYLNGCSGDINPLSNTVNWGSGTRETLQIYGRDLAAAARRGLSASVPWTTGPIHCASSLIPLEAAPASLEQLQTGLEQVRKRLAESPEDGLSRVDERWHELQISYQTTGTLAREMSAEIQAIACGDVYFAGLSAEAFTRLGQIIRDSAPSHLGLIAATCNGVRGYIATREDVEGGGYASASAAKIYGMPLPAPGAGEKWAQEGAGVVAAALGTGERDDGGMTAG